MLTMVTFLRVRIRSVYSVHDAVPAYKERSMLLARLVTGRYGYAEGEEYAHPVVAVASKQGWIAKVLAVFFARKRG